MSISQVIEQDINIFDGAELLATSERDLFSSGFLPHAHARRGSTARSCSIGFRQFRRRGSDWDRSGYHRRRACQDRRERSILTIPLATRQREIEREIDDLDRGVHLAVLWLRVAWRRDRAPLAERIADPVRRLTRATRRIASGDFDARIAVRFRRRAPRRLVDDIQQHGVGAEGAATHASNGRTRLEAWAEMARQVAHEIKNPLTPIQLSGRAPACGCTPIGGEPLGPRCCESCVDVDPRSGPAAPADLRGVLQLCVLANRRRAQVDLPALVAEVIDPYRSGLCRPHHH